MEMADEGLVIATVVGLSLLLALAVHRAFFRPCAERPERMSKQAKKEAKYEARKQGMRVKREDYRRRRSARLSSEFEGLDEEEQSALKLRLRRDKEDAQQRVARGFEQGLNVCVELSFENSARELRSLCKQLSLLYGANRSAQCPAHIHLTALAAPLRDMLQQQGLDAWTVSTSAESVMDLFPPEQIVVLSPDATDVVHVFESSKVYVIGGIVDRSVRSGVTLDWARQRGVRAMRLPVREHVLSKQSHVLNLDSVLTMITKFSETGDWTKAVEEAVPTRKK